MHLNMESVKKVIKRDNIQDFDPDLVDKTQTTFQFDEEFTFKLIDRGGNGEDYYRHMSCVDVLDKVQDPVIFFHSKDDPICR